MIKHILLPLDGSSLAETALPVALHLVKILSGRLTLLHVLELEPPQEIHGERHLRDPAEARLYLEELQQRYGNSNHMIESHVHSQSVSRVAHGIVAHVEELHPDLIVMCTHGGGDLKRLLKGSLAQQVVGLGKTPLLLVRPEAARKVKEFALRSILVPLDGQAEHEGGMAIGLELAEAGHCRLQLLSVIVPPSFLSGSKATLDRFMPGATRRLQVLAADNLRHYLQEQQERAEAWGIAATAELKRGEIAEEIVRSAETNEVDLIVLATHGKAGTDAFWANSVAARVQSETSRPLLLVPLGAVEETSV